MRQIAIHISKWYRSKGLYRTVQSILCSRKQKEDDADGCEHLYIERAHTIYREHTLYRETASKQVIPDHTYLYRSKPAQNPIYRPKTAHIWWIYRFSPTYSQILVLLVGIIDFSREQSFLPIAPGL